MLTHSADVDSITDEIRTTVAAPGMTCVRPDGRRAHPLRKAHPGVAEAAVMEHVLVGGVGTAAAAEVARVDGTAAQSCIRQPSTPCTELVQGC
jgi:hypothetical protein